MFKGNKGEWSEIYTLLKLLSDQKVHVGDKDLNEIPNMFYPILKVIREENDGKFEYSINNKIKIIQNGNVLLSITINEFKEKSLLLLNAIKSNKGSFQVPELESFLSTIKCKTLKAKSSAKADIKIIIHDLKTNMLPDLGFSIKSQLGSPSTLLNASKATNFIYQIEGDISDSLMHEINSITGAGKIKKRLEEISTNGNTITFREVEKNIFRNNLVLIDSLLPELLSEITKEFYSSHESKTSSLTSTICNSNPLKFDLSHNHKYYEYKLKKFLTDIAIGMMPASVWTGLHDATGGYLVVKSNGDILAYHLYNRNEFEDYLFHNTKLDTASSTRHDFGSIFKENNEYFIKLNLQIRFIK